MVAMHDIQIIAGFIVEKCASVCTYLSPLILSKSVVASFVNHFLLISIYVLSVVCPIHVHPVIFSIHALVTVDFNVVTIRPSSHGDNRLFLVLL
jgi:hypothetical protein